MKKLNALFAALTGAAASIPGIAVTKEFEFPLGTEPLFQFALVTFSAAVVLLGYVARREIQRCRPFLAVGIGALGMLVVLVAFIGHIWLSNVVLVEHSYDSSGKKFFPLFLSADHQRLVDSVGGRRKLIETRPFGPGVVSAMTTEGNVALTLGTLVLSYTALIGSVSLLFAFLGFHAVATAEGEDV